MYQLWQTQCLQIHDFLSVRLPNFKRKLSRQSRLSRSGGYNFPQPLTTGLTAARSGKSKRREPPGTHPLQESWFGEVESRRCHPVVGTERCPRGPARPLIRGTGAGCMTGNAGEPVVTLENCLLT
ncbi:unnamed protein product [Ixodes hexagonus]